MEQLGRGDVERATSSVEANLQVRLGAGLKTRNYGVSDAT
jgi:hypothetical protein